MKVRSTATIALARKPADEDPIVVDPVELGADGPEDRVERGEDRHGRVAAELEADVDVEDEPAAGRPRGVRAGGAARGVVLAPVVWARLPDGDAARANSRRLARLGRRLATTARRRGDVRAVGPRGEDDPLDLRLAADEQAAQQPDLARGSARSCAGSACRSRRPPTSRVGPVATTKPFSSVTLTRERRPPRCRCRPGASEASRVAASRSTGSSAVADARGRPTRRRGRRRPAARPRRPAARRGSAAKSVPSASTRKRLVADLPDEDRRRAPSMRHRERVRQAGRRPGRA